MIISSSAATSPTPITTAVFLSPCAAGPLPAALRLFDRRQAFGIRKLKRIGGQAVRRGRGVCRAELVHDAPFAAAIGACVLTSLVAPIRSTGAEDEDGGGGMDSTDTRIAIMAIIGFIPYFNWLSWVFAWLDTSKPRYLVYSIVYLAPYLSWKQASGTEILMAFLSLMRHSSCYPLSLERKTLLSRVMRNHQREEARSMLGHRHLPTSQETGFENGGFPEIKLMDCTGMKVVMNQGCASSSKSVVSFRSIRAQLLLRASAIVAAGRLETLWRKVHEM